jgi:hypothetical protein
MWANTHLSLTYWCASSHLPCTYLLGKPGLSYYTRIIQWLQELLHHQLHIAKYSYNLTMIFNDIPHYIYIDTPGLTDHMEVMSECLGHYISSPLTGWPSSATPMSLIRHIITCYNMVYPYLSWPNFIGSRPHIDCTALLPVYLKEGLSL